MSTACIIIIGNEILSGRTQDINLSWLAKELNTIGVRLREARVVPDVPEAIISAVNALRSQYDYVFTTGGIGPTHDDITSLCIAKAFGVPYERHKEAEAILTQYYPPDKLNEARLKMSDMPRGATLIHNPVSAAPGYFIGNVYVMAGVPSIMRSMFDGIRHLLKGGKPVLSVTVSTYLSEGSIAERLTEIQNEFPDVDIGSYPFVRDGKLGTSLVARHEDEALLMQVEASIKQMVTAFGGIVIDFNNQPEV
jgi:molybdenum cofactor synthesis domain-containing protein